MLRKLAAKLSGDGIGARVMRGSALTVIGFGISQIMRLGSNLVLTRLLFPEAFGLMAIVNLFLVGAHMFSDIGLVTGIVRSKRGDEPIFLNTAWVLQILRGILLTVIFCIIAGPVARFYEEPILEQLLYCIGLITFLMGFNSTRIATATREIAIARTTLLDLSCQTLSIISMIFLAWLWESVWALMVGMVVAVLAKAVLSHLMLPGHPNRLQFEREAFLEQFHYGKFLFISSGLTFVIENGDRVLLSKYLSLAYLGFYNIAFFFASVPMTLMGRLVHRVIFPLYSARPPMESEANRRAISKTRFGLTGGLFVILFVLGLLGQWLIELLYTDEYQAAGPILVLMAVFLMPSLIVQGYPTLLLSVGKSNIYMGFQIFRAVVQVAFLAVGVTQFGLIGAMAAQPLASVLIYPVLVYLIRPYRGEDPLHDIVFALLAILCGMIVFWANDAALARVWEISV